VIFSLAALALIRFALDVRLLVGRRTFDNLLIGRYHRPRREDHNFVFFDIAGSARAALRLGDEKFHSYVSRCFPTLIDQS